jgi:hypothetical protein
VPDPDILRRRAEYLGVPVIPAIPTPKDKGPNPVVAICGECGLELHRVMGYVCSRENCPCFPRITC